MSKKQKMEKAKWKMGHNPSIGTLPVSEEWFFLFPFSTFHFPNDEVAGWHYR